MDIDFDTLEYNYIHATQLYENINSLWLNEINSQGFEYGYDNQAVYKTTYDLLISFSFVELEKSSKSDEFIRSVTPILTASLKENIRLFEKYKTLFNGLDREKIQLDFYRKKINSTLSDFDLKIELVNVLESIDRDEYFKSSIYNEYAFLSENFHHQIYLFTLRLIKSINNNFENHERFDPIPLKNNTTEFFDLILIGKLYQVINKIVFEPSTQLDFYREINLLHSVSNLKIRKGYRNHSYYVFYKLSESIQANNSKYWLDGILLNFDLSMETYNSKYKQISKIDSLKDFVNGIDLLFEENKTK
ncbi:hypothetical protein [Flavobacterium petrolei]|uniref:hypothetical protein n=1 Tax=Flavobacterium petrolei TaxID=2259594 RepID=UPI00375813AE